ncbi:MAG: hypothetical protein J6T74_07395, partial [Clostridia bacterium]|nr:hypothetical protein [Clostridia bacterium]
MEKVTISNLQGESGLANVVRYFANNGAEYLIYSLNEVDEAGYTRLYVTKINGVDGNYNADTLNDSEWTEIKNLVKLIVKANKENQPIPVQDINPDKIKNIVLKDKKIFKLNTPLVNDLAANTPKFGNDDSEGTEGEQKNILDTPAQPVFEVPSAPTFDTPAQPTFEVPGAPAFNMGNVDTNSNTYDFESTNPFETQMQAPTSNINETSSNDLQSEIDRLNEELAK